LEVAALAFVFAGAACACAAGGRGQRGAAMPAPVNFKKCLLFGRLGLGSLVSVA